MGLQCETDLGRDTHDKHVREASWGREGGEKWWSTLAGNEGGEMARKTMSETLGGGNDVAN